MPDGSRDEPPVGAAPPEATPTEIVRVEATGTPVYASVTASPVATLDPDTPTPFPEDTPAPTVIIEYIEVEVPTYIRCVATEITASIALEMAKAAIIVCPE